MLLGILELVPSSPRRREFWEVEATYLGKSRGQQEGTEVAIYFEQKMPQSAVPLPGPQAARTLL